ncbi:MAG: hypothetical protein ACNA8P_01450 [Phycisphaerales bacterium]
MFSLFTCMDSLIAGVTHIPRRRDPPGFWDSYRGSRTDPEGFEVVQNSGVEWWIVVIGAIGLVYFAFHARGFVRFLRGKRERRRQRTIHPIPGPEDRMRQFKDYRKR